MIAFGPRRTEGSTEIGANARSAAIPTKLKDRIQWNFDPDPRRSPSGGLLQADSLESNWSQLEPQPVRSY